MDKRKFRRRNFLLNRTILNKFSKLEVYAKTFYGILELVFAYMFGRKRI